MTNNVRRQHAVIRDINNYFIGRSFIGQQLVVRIRPPRNRSILLCTRNRSGGTIPVIRRSRRRWRRLGVARVSPIRLKRRRRSIGGTEYPRWPRLGTTRVVPWCTITISLALNVPYEEFALRGAVECTHSMWNTLVHLAHARSEGGNWLVCSRHVGANDVVDCVEGNGVLFHWKLVL